MTKKLTAITLFLLANTFLFAQNTTNDTINTTIAVADTTILKKDSIKIKRFQPALILGPTIVRVGISKKELNGTTNDVAETDLGFNLGFALRINLGRRFYLLPQAALYFQGSSLSYNSTTKKFDAKADFKPLTLDVPVHLIWKWNESKRFTPAFHVGARYIGDISSSTTKSIGIKSGDVALEAGVGFEIRIWKISIMPRVGATIGLTNLLDGAATSGLYESVRRQKFEIGFLIF
jgi:Outer membrane protein beta-barrel domain